MSSYQFSNSTLNSGCSVDLSVSVVTFYGSGCSMASSDTFYDFAASTEYFFVISSVAGGGDIQVQEGCGTDHQTFDDSQTLYQFSITSASGPCADNYLQIAGGLTNWNSNSTAHVTYLCVSDVSYDECIPVDPPLSTSTPATLNDVIFIQGFMLFFVVVMTLVFLFNYNKK